MSVKPMTELALRKHVRAELLKIDREFRRARDALLKVDAMMANLHLFVDETWGYHEEKRRDRRR